MEIFTTTENSVKRRRKKIWHECKRGIEEEKKENERLNR